MSSQDQQQDDWFKQDNWFTRSVSWVDERFPATETFEYHMSRYYAPKNFNFFYFFGVLAIVMLAVQIISGVWLTMNYAPTGPALKNEMPEVEDFVRFSPEYGRVVMRLQIPMAHGPEG